MVTVMPAAPVHVEEAAQVLAGALRDDAMMSAFVGGRPNDHEKRLAHLYEVFIREGLRHGAVDLARAEGESNVLGVAVWSAPGRARGTMVQQLRDLRAYTRAFGLRRLLGARTLEGTLHAARPGEPHWYLAVIGVHPAGHGHGVGSALLRTRLSTIDRTGTPAYLEASTERSAALYARFGFTSIGTVAGFPPPVEPIAMWRAGVGDRSSARTR
ncbi:acetyltransferase (GNAT) family protein [Tamaricihabitans halophyticus]|uniref:Acetyltransferase (GNAT) family protein n=1 Tax=Tamaricihabitans halophyticus TaxID=1262583 RepID=A0A4R2Q0Q9_9PSEU|nr:GNAT family N-acetyltransferase [Tamaricihabitans halophyticus]TCP41254.1 acetyltransferase (GNAT) family protein [Tamaricihabitans halophyticus]